MKKKAGDAWNPHGMAIYRCIPRRANNDGCCGAMRERSRQREFDWLRNTICGDIVSKVFQRMNSPAFAVFRVGSVEMG